MSSSNRTNTWRKRLKNWISLCVLSKVSSNSKGLSCCKRPGYHQQNTRNLPPISNKQLINFLTNANAGRLLKNNWQIIAEGVTILNLKLISSKQMLSSWPSSSTRRRAASLFSKTGVSISPLKLRNFANWRKRRKSDIWIYQTKQTQGVDRKMSNWNCSRRPSKNWTGTCEILRKLWKTPTRQSNRRIGR